MDIFIGKELLEAMGKKALLPYGIDDEKNRWNSSYTIDLRRFSNEKIRKLRDLLEPHNKANVKTARLAFRDINVWIEAAEKGAEGVKCKNTKHFDALAYEFIQKLPGHVLYSKDDDRDVWDRYYVGKIEFHPKQSTRDGGVQPAYTYVKLYYSELGNVLTTGFSVQDHEVRGLTVPEVLVNEGYLVETPELAEQYKSYMNHYQAIYDKIGKQFLARGIGTTNLDGNEGRRSRSAYRSWGFDTIQMERAGEPSRVVIDVVQEGDEKNRDREDRPNPDFWRTRSLLDAEDAEDLDVIEPGDEDSDEPAAPLDIPVHPVVPVFDLKRHMRIRVHVGNLVAYEYDTKLGEKLVLPKESRDLIEILLQSKGDFKDIIKSKGGGAIILSAGPPGVGKTLTAEVFAEVEGRPLYSVQASQLGTNEEDLEQELLKVFARSARWNAILLLDEADVYVAARGHDLQQNAIVGVFLRVLEYYHGVLFLTTNRADLVDDAISSRCVARLDYGIPSQADQAKIWRILADVAGLSMTTKTISEIVIRYPLLSGRDVKQLLKLASLVTRSKGETEITTATVEFVKRFKPSNGDGRPEGAPALKNKEK
jgi:hypothetical protein